MENDDKRGGLVSYIQDQLSQNKTREEITQVLRGMNWTNDEINQGFLEIDENKQRRKKKIMMNVGATLFVILALIIIIFISSSSPFSKKTIKGEDVIATPQAAETTGTEEVLPPDEMERIRLMTENISLSETAVTPS